MASRAHRSRIIGLLAEMVRTSPRQSAAAGALLLVLTFTEGLTLLLLMPLLELVGVVEENPLPQATGWLAPGFGAIGLEPSLGAVLILFVGISAVRAGLQRWQQRLNATVRENLPAAYRIRLYRAMAAAEWKFLATRSASELVQAIAHATGRMGIIATRLIDLAVAAATVVVYAALALRLSAPITVLVLACAAAMSALMRASLASARRAGAESAAAAADMHAMLTEQVGGLKLARASGVIDRHVERFIELVARSRGISLAASATEDDLQQQLELGSTALLALVVFMAANVVGLSAPVLLLLLYIFARLMPRVLQIYRLLQSIASSVPVFDSLKQLERDCLDAAQRPVAQQRTLAPLSQAIVFDDVCFTYPERSTPAVAGLTLRLGAGLSSAIVGASGAGKSTVADLLLGLLQPDTGRVVVDGVALDSSTVDSWRRQIGFVPQDTFLFHGSVRDNLSWATPSATTPEMWDALRLAAADVFVAELPNGLDTIIGERGVRLSGGERQRLAIARALLRHPRLLVLDEATSAVDAENELRIQQAIEGLQHRLTIVIITHRLSTIRRADAIHVLEAGALVESGTWDILLADRDSRFSALADAAGIDAPRRRA